MINEIQYKSNSEWDAGLLNVLVGSKIDSSNTIWSVSQCIACGGRGGVFDAQGNWYTCPRCNGTGFEPN